MDTISFLESALNRIDWHSERIKSSGWAPLSCKQASRVKVKVVDPVQECKHHRRQPRRLLSTVVQNPKAGCRRGTCLLITASLSGVFPCLSDICSRCVNNVVLEKQDSWTVGLSNTDLCQGATRLPVTATQVGPGAATGTNAGLKSRGAQRLRALSFNTPDGFQHICWLFATSAPALNSYIYF